MAIPYSEPRPSGTERAELSVKCRKAAMRLACERPHAKTLTNMEEMDYGPEFPTNFTKGLAHDENGILQEGDDYLRFVKAINSDDWDLFENGVISYGDRVKDGEAKVPGFLCKALSKDKKSSTALTWRGWESPRAGHVYDLQGPDAAAVGMAPAPRVGSSELAFEMAEVYSLALLRDVPFSVICEGGDQKLCDGGGKAEISAKDVVGFLNKMDFLNNPISSTPNQAGKNGLNVFEDHRREARLLRGGAITTETAFRGSTKGAMQGPYISQFMLIGNDSLNCSTGNNGKSNFPGESSDWDFRDGFISYGSQPIDQRSVVAKGCVDYMTDWASWLDVQNGANMRFEASKDPEILQRLDVFEKERRFITTPRDLATYVHIDALYQAYLNAALIMLGLGVPASKGFPEKSPSGRRDAFATYGPPHILSLVTEVATRCLKAVRRQKFNYHRRARPEALGGRLSLLCGGDGGALGNAEEAFKHLFGELEPLHRPIQAHNEQQNSESIAECRRLYCEAVEGAPSEKCNMLLAMAFPEGSPMHPAYGAGHATVAGGCVTMLKAFFEMFESGNSTVERELVTPDGTSISYEPDLATKGTKLKKSKSKDKLTVQGELDKLAANISIGRNMAGVHYYSDYFDSLRMGERVAVGILVEQAATYGEHMEMRFNSFDGDLITISGDAGKQVSITIVDKNGNPVSEKNWWLRHVPGEEPINKSALHTS